MISLLVMVKTTDLQLMSGSNLQQTQYFNLNVTYQTSKNHLSNIVSTGTGFIPKVTCESRSDETYSLV